LVFVLLAAACDNESIAPDSPEVDSMSIDTQPAKRSYALGEGFSSAGLALNVVYPDGSTGRLTGGWTLTWNDAPLAQDSTAITESTGNKSVIVAYGGKTAVFDISVLAGTAIAIARRTDWTSALTRISADSDGTSSDPRVYILDIQGSILAPIVTSQETSIRGSYKTVRLTGNGTLFLASLGWGSIFRIGDSSQTLVIDGPTLSGMRGNNEPVVYAGDGTVELLHGTICGNTDSNGGGVYVGKGTFAMSGGAVSGNTASGSNGGGVYVKGGTFVMSGGAVSGNTARWGGGVYLSGGTFAMSGGTIDGNTASSANGGGGVYMDGETFTMTGGTISGNTAGRGGGVCEIGGTFILQGGTISGNAASNMSRYSNGGGGVYVAHNGTSFAMTGGVISGNTAKFGGGVYVWQGTFTKTGGTIYGDADHIPGNGNATDNTATDPTNPDINGHAALYDNSSFISDYYYRNETLPDDASGNISAANVPNSGAGNNWTKKQ
jgi:hypothetical protein